MKKILITGVAGFIGTNLALRLLDQKSQVIGLDNFSSGRRENIEFLSKYKNFEFVEHDIIENFNLNSDIDEIYNLACVASPQKYQNQPFNTLDTCYIGTKNLLSLAKQKNAKVLHASTSEVYGDPQTNPQHEQYRGNVNTFGLRACYDEGKRVAETLCFEFLDKYSVDIRIPRIFNTFGPHMSSDDGRVVSNFINQCIRNEPLTLYGSGKQTRSLQYITDLLRGFEFLMKSNYSHPINLGGTSEISVITIANMILELIPESKSYIIFRELPMDDPQIRSPSIATAQSVLDWNPQVEINAGLLETIKYFKSLKAQ